MTDFDARHTADWGDGTYVFRLGLAELLELQEKTGVGPLELATRIRSGQWRVQDLRETVRLGLIGGGKLPTDALALVRRYVDARPLLENVGLAVEVLTVALSGPPEEAPGKGGATVETGASPPPPSTDAAQ